MANEKGSHFFRLFIRVLEKYLSLFELAESEKITGEVSVWYLYSKAAPQYMRGIFGEIKIIATMGNLVNEMYSLRSQYIYERDEEILDSNDAVAAKAKGRQGMRLPPSQFKNSECHYYQEVFSYSRPTHRYMAVFVAVCDAFKRSPRVNFDAVLEFLGSQSSEQSEPPIISPTKMHRNALILWASQVVGVGAKWVLLRLTHNVAVHIPIERLLMFVYRTLSTCSCQCPLLAEGTSTSFSRSFEADVERPGRILQHNMNRWMGPPAAPRPIV